MLNAQRGLLGNPPAQYASMTPKQFQQHQQEQQASFRWQQSQILNREFQDLQQNLPLFNSETSQSLTQPQQVDSSKKGHKKTKAKRGKNVVDEPQEPVAAGRWLPVEEELLATCYVAVLEDNNLMEQELRLKREAAERAFEAQAEKDRILMRLEELRSPYSGKRSPVGRWREKADMAPESAGRDRERKEVINHFGHEKHPLKLIDWEMIRGKGDDEEENSKGAVVECDMCEEPLSIGDSAIDKGFAYLSFSNAPTGFNCCSNCFFVEFACKAEDDSLKEEASIKFQHEGHPQHTLTLQSRPAAFRCDACKTEEKGLFYLCDSCDFWIHKTCASLAPTIDLPYHHHKHPLVLVYSLPEKFYTYPYFAHIKCALNAPSPSTPRDRPSTSGANEDSNSLLHFPMSDVFTDPLKLLHLDNLSLDDIDKLEIKHQSHRHPLTLNVEPQHNNMPSTSDSIEGMMRCPIYAMVVPATATHLHTNVKLIASFTYV
ncbi:C1-like protein [Tanacetum coccineum]